MKTSPKPWPVLLLARELDQGGSERQLTEIAKTLDRSRFEPHVGFLRPGGLRAKELEAAGIPTTEFPVESFRSLDPLGAAWRLVRFIRTRKIRLVHTFDYPLTVFAAPVARFLTSAVVVSSQRAHRELIPQSYFRMVRGTDRIVDAIVVNCEFVRRHLERDEGVPPQKIHLCRNTIDTEKFQPLDRSPKNAEASSPLVIGTVCALRREKDLRTLLSAFERVRRGRFDLKLVIVGSGTMLEPLRAQANALGLREICRFVPATANVADWLRSMDIFVLPSRSEALSNSLMEAMACGCCPIASNVGGNPELVRNGETGLLFEPGDVAGLSAALTAAVADGPLRLRLAAAARIFIRDNRAPASRIEEIYGQLIDLRRRAAA